jgi:hypothetical protein|tara:strand:- start:713 stop:880 length:168 start_codon:yes stop_codon:yes gene_type:complete
MTEMETSRKFRVNVELTTVVEGEDNADALRRVITDAIEMGSDVLNIKSTEIKSVE